MQIDPPPKRGSPTAPRSAANGGARRAWRDRAAAPVAGHATVAPRPEPAHSATPRQWAEILQQLGAEIAGPLSLALDRIQELDASGQIDRRGLRQLRQSVSDARLAGMLGQQLARLASGRVRLSRERVALAPLVRSVLSQRSRETQSRGLQIRQALEPAEVWADTALLHTLLNALLDGALAQSHSSIELRLSLQAWPAGARLSCSFPLTTAEADTDATADTAQAGPLAWRLVEQAALCLGLKAHRSEQAGLSRFWLDFEDLAAPEAPSAQAATSEPPAPAEGDGALQGARVGLISAEPGLAAEVQAAVRHLGVVVDAFDDPAEAGAALDALLIDAGLPGPELEAHRAAFAQAPQPPVLILLAPGDVPTRLSTATEDGCARIGRAHLPDALPGLLTFELTRPR